MSNHLPPARPSPPRNCTAKRIILHNEALLSVKCAAGYDGGLNQHFTLDILGENGRTLANTTANFMDMIVWFNVSWSAVDSLEDDEDLAVTARNSKGASDPVLLRDLVFRDAEKRAGEEYDTDDVFNDIDGDDIFRFVTFLL
ncbi:hypothetical protein HF086_011164 [Spodoptera exigua]|uniref:Uncharacterized protein n=1 Tax=Spodoptera exigua TaxID=7107 RepID=A0A922SM77_SPOEX|nr:hypothetical protein HF086_011164 [Spodoptera exigua]